MKTIEQDNALNSILEVAIAQAQRSNGDVKEAAEAAAKAYVAGLAAADATPDPSVSSADQ